MRRSRVAYPWTWRVMDGLESLAARREVGGARETVVAGADDDGVERLHRHQ